MAKDYFYDVITSRYLKPNEGIGLFNLMEIQDDLNSHLANQQNITYREYVDILRKYFKNADYPGCFWDILDDQIPVKIFLWGCSEGYDNVKKVGDKLVFDEKDKIYIWILDPVEKKKA